ncbi:MAG TPA: hypothetical protein VE423_03180, partial [Microvirga sp.]|nr:hypothetical protein [Microvirga sp.]
PVGFTLWCAAAQSAAALLYQRSHEELGRQRIPFRRQVCNTKLRDQASRTRCRQGGSSPQLSHQTDVVVAEQVVGQGLGARERLQSVLVDLGVGWFCERRPRNELRLGINPRLPAKIARLAPEQRTRLEQMADALLQSK